MKKLSLIIATLGRYKELEALLASLAGQTISPDLFEVIIVDQNDRIDLAPLLARFGHQLVLRHIKSDKKGLSLNRNIGLELAQGDVVAFPDDDCTYYPDTLERVLALFRENGKVSLFLGAIHDRETDQHIIREWPRRPIRVTKWNFFFLLSSITIFSADRKMRFDERLGAGTNFGSNEDADYVFRILNSGVAVRYHPSIEVWHPAQPIAGIPAAKIRMYGLGFGGFVVKNRSVPTVVLFLKVVGYHVAKAFIAACLLDFSRAAARFTAAYSRVLGTILW